MTTPARHGRSKKHRNSHAREVALQALYQIEIGEHSVDHVLRFGWLNEPLPAAQVEFATAMISGVVDHPDALDGVITSLSNKDFTQISTINRCILRMGMLELTRSELEPGMVIDDLLNLTRKYDGEESVPFINGILDRFVKERGAKENE